MRAKSGPSFCSTVLLTLYFHVDMQFQGNDLPFTIIPETQSTKFRSNDYAVRVHLLHLLHLLLSCTHAACIQITDQSRVI